MLENYYRIIIDSKWENFGKVSKYIKEALSDVSSKGIFHPKKTIETKIKNFLLPENNEDYVSFKKRFGNSSSHATIKNELNKIAENEIVTSAISLKEKVEINSKVGKNEYNIIIMFNNDEFIYANKIKDKLLYSLKEDEISYALQTEQY